jgi:hypothetical protein
MNIKAVFSYPFESQSEFLKRIKKRYSLPDGIFMKGPFFHFGARDRITTILIFEFDESRYPEALANISMQYDEFHAVPGLDFTMMVSKEGFERKISSELAWNKIDEKDFSR